MRNDKIGEGLKRYRKQNQMTISDVAIEIRKRYNQNVAEKTIYGWESNQAHPTSDMLISLCEIYHISDLSEAFGNDEFMRKSDFKINAEERSLIEHYRQQPALQDVVKRVLNMESKKHTT